MRACPPPWAGCHSGGSLTSRSRRAWPYSRTGSAPGAWRSADRPKPIARPDQTRSRLRYLPDRGPPGPGTAAFATEHAARHRPLVIALKYRFRAHTVRARPAYRGLFPRRPPPARLIDPLAAAARANAHPGCGTAIQPHAHHGGSVPCERVPRADHAKGQTMTGPIFQRGATVKVGRRRSFPGRPARRAGLSAALAIPALTVASGSAMAVTAARAAAHKVHQNRPDAGQAVTAGIGAAGTASRTVLAWGRNTTGQLGDGTTTSTSTPVRVHLPAGTKVTQVQGRLRSHAGSYRQGSCAGLGKRLRRSARRRPYDRQRHPGPGQAAPRHQDHRDPGWLRAQSGPDF